MRSMTAMNAVRARGLSLIEMMVALVLGLLLTAAILQVYLANKQTFLLQEQNGYLQESGRFAIEYMARDARMAGLLGCASRRLPTSTLPVINYLNGGTAFPWLTEAGISGYEANGTGPGATLTLTASNPSGVGSGVNWAPALPAALTTLAGAGIGRPVPGTDVLVVSGMGPQGWPLVDPYTSGAQIFVQTGNDIAAGDILLVSDCLQAEIFQATNVSATGGKTNVVGAQSGTYSPGNANNINARGPVTDFRRGSEVSRIRTFAYYVGQGADGMPALFRTGLQRSTATTTALITEELIGGVESLQVLYGVDTDANYGVDSYVTADAVTDWQQVRALRLGVLVRAPDETGTDADDATYVLEGTTVDPVDDRRKRRVFSSAVTLRNRML